MGLIKVVLSDIAVPLLSKLGDSQALCLGQIMLKRQLSSLSEVLSLDLFSSSESSLSSSGLLVESISDLLSEKVSVKLELASL